MFVAAADDLEEVAGGFAGHREVAELIDDQQLRAVPEAHGRGPAALERGPAGAGDKVGGRCVVDAVAGLDRAVAEDGREHRLPDARRADQQDVRAVVDEPQRREVLDQAPIQRGLGGEVELLERLARRQLGEPQPALQSTLLDGGDFGGEQVAQELGVAGRVLSGVRERGGEAFGDCAQAQVGEVLAQLMVGGVGHQQASAKAA